MNFPNSPDDWSLARSGIHWHKQCIDLPYKYESKQKDIKLFSYFKNKHFSSF